METAIRRKYKIIKIRENDTDRVKINMKINKEVEKINMKYLYIHS